MARIRYLKPTFFSDEDVADLSIEARLFFMGLWCHADREGRLECKPRTLKVLILPYDNIDIKKLLDELHPKFAAQYESGGKDYIQIVNFLKHQKPHKAEKESEIPKFTEQKTRKNPSKTVKVRRKTVQAQKFSEGMGMGMGNGDGELATEKGGVGVDSHAPSKPPFNEFADRYFVYKFKAPIGVDTKTARKEVSALYSRHGRALRDILAFSGGVVAVAIEGTFALEKYFDREGLSFTLDTIAKRFAEWKADPSKFEGKKKPKDAYDLLVEQQRNGK